METESSSSLRKVSSSKKRKLPKTKVEYHEAEVETVETKKQKKSKRINKINESVDETTAEHSSEVIEEISHEEHQSELVTNTHAPNQSSIFSNEEFSSLPISVDLKSALASMGFTRMTLIQAKSIPECLKGHDVVGAAKTGSGKTLSFLIPIIELLNHVQFTRKQGTGAIIISPTRELSLQTYGVLSDLMEHTKFPQTHGLIMGGANRKAEADKLVKGVNIIVATPGRLVDHLSHTAGFNYGRLLLLIIDEADRILEQGFEEDMHQIIKLLPKERQTMLFSATQTQKVEDLTRLSMRSNPVYVGVHDDSERATVDGLQQGYVVCPSEKRFMLLYTFLKKNKNKKVMVCYIPNHIVKQ